MPTGRTMGVRPVIKTHVHIGLNEDGDPVAAFETITEAREAVEDDSSLTNREIVDYWPDVPLKNSDEDTETNEDDQHE
jgi:hypothetical protein